MDKGTQEKVKPEQRWSFHSSFVCKECKHIHLFSEYDGDEEIADQFEFPNPPHQYPVIIPCLNRESARHRYEYEEIILPPLTRVEAKLGEIEQRLSRLEGVIDLGDVTQDEKPIRGRIASLEDMVTKLIQGKPKEPRQELHQ